MRRVLYTCSTTARNKSSRVMMPATLTKAHTSCVLHRATTHSVRGRRGAGIPVGLALGTDQGPGSDCCWGKLPSVPAGSSAFPPGHTVGWTLSPAYHHALTPSLQTWEPNLLSA